VLGQAGAIAIPRAADERVCAGLIEEIRASPAMVTRPISPRTMRREHFPDFARSKTVRATSFAHAVVELVLAGQLEQLQRFFRRPLEASPELHFLTYDRGDFIRPHRDVMQGEGVLEKIRERLAVFTLFLNDAEGPGEQTFEGGELVLQPTPDRRLTLTCAPGTLLAFRADLVHSVRPVTAGTRHSVAGWFRARNG
jgi:predicted 2-oxoglutarate/Fe(II)-dependent dioxygenase YbiX